MDWERDPAQGAKVRDRLQLPPGFPDKYRSGIVKAMELCAVKKHIQTPPEFVTEIVD
jgi:ribosomal protein S12 methylthiotransferase accessory factor